MGFSLRLSKEGHRGPMPTSARRPFHRAGTGRRTPCAPTGQALRFPPFLCRTGGHISPAGRAAIKAAPTGRLLQHGVIHHDGVVLRDEFFPSSAPSIPSTRRNRVLCRVKPPQYSPGSRAPSHRPRTGRSGGRRPATPLQMGVRHLEHQPPGVGGVVAHHEIHVVVEAGGPAAKGLGAVGVGKHVVAVPPPLGDGEGCGGSSSRAGWSSGTGRPPRRRPPCRCAESSPPHSPSAGWACPRPARRRGSPRLQRQAVQPGRRQAQVGDLAALEGHVLPRSLRSRGVACSAHR